MYFINLLTPYLRWRRTEREEKKKRKERKKVFKIKKSVVIRVGFAATQVSLLGITLWWFDSALTPISSAPSPYAVSLLPRAP